jgi:hypothetical protein
MPGHVAHGLYRIIRLEYIDLRPTGAEHPFACSTETAALRIPDHCRLLSPVTFPGTASHGASSTTRSPAVEFQGGRNVNPEFVTTKTMRGVSHNRYSSALAVVGWISSMTVM